ncbi:MAG: hypothetical protein J07HQX50_02062 [Haloquadratum sp. J07HQX50]|nr:MAG: hypothetical protein J07HQX50_02062 [Haloquadratum sp. J07HQX50]
MTQVCFIGTSETGVQYELLSRETARDALSTYDISEPFTNSLAVETVSLGTAITLCNDLNWYLTRFVALSLIQESSVSDTEWLSRSLAEAVRNGEVEPEESGKYLAVYGIEENRPVEPLYVIRGADETIPRYDLRDVSETLIVRLSADEFK